MSSFWGKQFNRLTVCVCSSCIFEILVISPFAFEGWGVHALVVSIPGHCLSFTKITSMPF